MTTRPIIASEHLRSECPSPEEWSNWLLRGEISGGDFEGHVEICLGCRVTLDRLTQSTLVDSYVQSVTSRPSGLSFLAPPERVGDLGTLGQYAIERELDSGGMGIVFRAWDKLLERPVAIKLMRMLDHAAAIERFRREARSVANLMHDNIVPVHAVGETNDGRPYLVMPFVLGESLRQRMNRNPIEPAEAAEWVRQIACGLHFAHSAGLIHRDVKPANILLDSRDGRAKLTDFGLVHDVQGQSMTHTGGILGTPEFMSPEQIRDEALDSRSDVYSLGITLYQLLTGVTPFRGQTFEVLRQQQEQIPLAPSLIRSEIPRDLETICLKSIHKEPDRRYESAQALADDLARFLAGDTILAKPASIFERGRVWIRQHPWQAMSGALAAVIFLGTAISALMLARSYRAERNANLALTQMRNEADRSFELTRDQLAVVVGRLKDHLLQLPQAEQAAIESIRDVSKLYSELNRIRPADQQVAEEYLTALKDEWYSEWLYDGDQLEQQALERFQAESVRLLDEFPASSTIAALRAELLLDLAIESSNAADHASAKDFQNQAQALLTSPIILSADSHPIRNLRWKVAWQAYQTARMQKAPAEQVVELAYKMVEAQKTVIEITPVPERLEAFCIGIDQMSRLAEALVEAGNRNEVVGVIEEAKSLLSSFAKDQSQTLEARQAKVRILRAELQLAKANRDLEAQEHIIQQLVEENRSILNDFPDGEVQMKSLVQALCEQIEFGIQQGKAAQRGPQIAEISDLLSRIAANPAVDAWATTYRQKLVGYLNAVADPK